jgi:ApaG protein
MVMRHIFPYAATTRGVTVRVAPRYLPEQSDDLEPRHVWSYHVRIENGGLEAIQLLARHWEITDGDGDITHVDGDGVIGQQPLIAPGEAFDYMSGCPLATPSGGMTGHYVMACAGSRFEVRIPAFALERASVGHA